MSLEEHAETGVGRSVCTNEPWATFATGRKADGELSNADLNSVQLKIVINRILESQSAATFAIASQMSTITAGLIGGDYFQKYPGRFNSMHLQDVDMNAPAPAAPGEGAPVPRRGGRRPQVAVGQGTIDWVKTFTAAKVGGVKNYFVEQSWELTQQSVAYLKTLKV
jgi:hypothetical protein